MTSEEKPHEREDAPELPIDSVGWLFVQKYYSTYTADLARLYAFYDAGAALVHDSFPAEEGKRVHVASGTAAIQAHFAAGDAQKNKIVVESAHFQPSVDKSILIVVTGLWKRGTAPLWQFVQTFVLRAKEKTVYDVANDVLKFFDLSAEYPAEEAADEPAAEPAAEPADAVDEPVAEPAPEPAEVVAEPATEAAVAEAGEPETEPEAAEAEQNGAVEHEAEDDGVKSPPAKQTWANLAAIAPQATAKTATVALPNAAKTAPAPSPVVKKSPQTTPQPAPAKPGKYKKEEWYPIYIRGVEVEEDELKAALTKQFGDIKFFKKNDKAALCDFRNKEDQQKALEAKEIVVRDNVILLEPRLHRTFNKPDFKKDKKPAKKNGVKKA